MQLHDRAFWFFELSIVISVSHRFVVTTQGIDAPRMVGFLKTFFVPGSSFLRRCVDELHPLSNKHVSFFRGGGLHFPRWSVGRRCHVFGISGLHKAFQVEPERGPRLGILWLLNGQFKKRNLHVQGMEFFR